MKAHKDTQNKLFHTIRVALDSALLLADRSDSKEVIDFLTTVQIKTAELQATFMTDIRNR